MSEDFYWRVTYSKDKPVNVEVGSDMPRNISDADQLRGVGETMIRIGTRLLKSDVDEDEE